MPGTDDPTRFLSVKRERLTQIFFGDGGYTAEEFVADIRRAWAAQPGNTDAHKLDLLHQSIGGGVSEELRCHPKEEREKPEVSLNIILTAFGEKRSTASLLVRLLQLEQRAGESIRDYSIRVSDTGERS